MVSYQQNIIDFACTKEKISKNTSNKVSHSLMLLNNDQDNNFVYFFICWTYLILYLIPSPGRYLSIIEDKEIKKNQQTQLLFLFKSPLIKDSTILNSVISRSFWNCVNRTIKKLKYWGNFIFFRIQNFLVWIDIYWKLHKI